jgi:hypothetical protein
LLLAQSFLVTYAGINSVENFVEFKVYAVHREGWAFAKAVSAAKIEYYAAIKRLREELGLVYVRAALPVLLQQRSGGDHGGYGGGRGLRAFSVEERDPQDEPFAEGVTHRPLNTADLRGRSNARADQVSPGTSPVGKEPKKSL